MKKFILIWALIAPAMFSQAQTLPAGPKVVIKGNMVNAGKINSSIPIDLQSIPNGTSTINNTQSGEIISAGLNVSIFTVFNNSGILTVTLAPIYVANIILPGTTRYDSAGGYPALEASVYPEVATNKTLVWTSSNPAVATVNATNGAITVISDGQTDITCKSTDGTNKISNTCKVTVAIQSSATSITVSGFVDILTTVGGSATYTAVVSPPAASQAIRWSSSDSNVATVNATTGVVTAVNNGTAIISATNIATATTPATGTKTVTVKIPYHTVNFSTGTSVTIPSQTVVQSGDITLPSIPTRSGYLFAGWCENNNLYETTPVLFPYYQSGNEVSNTTLYAKWISESDLSNADKRSAYYKHVIRNTVFKRNTRIIDIATLGAHDAFTHNISGSSKWDPIDENYNAQKSEFGSDLVDLAKSNCATLSKAQNSDAYTLANRGVRLYDGRITRYNNSWYTAHGLISNTLRSYILDILKFVKENPTEFIIFTCQRIYMNDMCNDGKNGYNALYDSINNIRYDGKNLFDYVKYNTSIPISQLTYGDVVNNGTGGVVLMFTGTAKTGPKSAGSYTHLTSTNYSNKVYYGGFGGNWHDESDADKLITKIKDEYTRLVNTNVNRNYIIVNQVQRTPGATSFKDIVKMISPHSLTYLNDESNKKIVNNNLAEAEKWFTLERCMWADNADGTDFNQKIIPLIHKVNLKQLY